MADSEETNTISCFFNCSNTSTNLITARRSRIETIIKCSLLRGDRLHSKLTHTQSIMCHKDCVSTYTSQHHMNRLKLSEIRTDEAPAAKNARRSNTTDFVFEEHCLFCGTQCVKLDSECHNPQRWRKVVQCKTVDRGEDRDVFKMNILLVCDKRGDSQASEVRIRVGGALADLHAANAQYHEDCYKQFMYSRAVNAVAKSDTNTSPADVAVVHVVNEMTMDKAHIWNSVELSDMYTTFGGQQLTRRQLIEHNTDHFGPDLIKLSGNGIASLFVFKGHASHLLRLVDDDDDATVDVKQIAKCIIRDCKNLNTETSTYATRITKETADEMVSPVLSTLLATISNKLADSNAALLIGNIVTNCITNKPTTLQVAMCVLLREKQLIDQCHAFGICAAYDEILRFKASAASAASQQTELTGLFNSDVGLVQALADNYDANISSANGLRSTHALALLLTQVNENENKVPTSPDTIKRLSKDEMKDSISHPVVASQTISLTRAHDIDYQFLRDIVVKPKTPEYNGFNTNLAREQGHSVKPATTAIYTPLIDMVPSDPDTIMTAMVEVQRITQECGQSITVFTNDQQLYRVAVNVTWVYPELFADFVPRLGGMHFLMSYIGAVGTLMANTGLSELMQTAFGGVPKMLTGKKFPQNMRALRLVAEELLRPVITATENYDELIALLDNKSHESRTAKLWVDNLIKPVLLMMMFVRAEREADWVLHLSVAAQMLPYLFASGHCNYARYGSYYLRSMEHLPAELLSEFLKGNHVMRHSAGIWNAIWSDMYIETTFMRYGHEAGGLTGLTLKPSAVARWALSLHACSQLRGDLVAMKNDTVDKVVTTHKEESTARIDNDSTDREKIHNALTNYIDPLATDVHPAGLINIVTGHHTTDKVNVDQSVSIGKQQMAEFESQWPGSFNKNISKKVTTMASTKKNIKVDETPVYETELIYTRVSNSIETLISKTS